MMVAENFPTGVVENVLKTFSGRASIAAINSADCYTLTGDKDALDEVERELESLQIGDSGNLLLKKNERQYRISQPSHGTGNERTVTSDRRH